MGCLMWDHDTLFIHSLWGAPVLALGLPTQWFLHCNPVQALPGPGGEPKALEVGPARWP